MSMSKFSFGGAFIGILSGIILWCIVLVIHHISKKRLLSGKKLIIFGAIVLCITIVLSIFVGNFMGYSIKIDFYEDKPCHICDEPSSAKLSLPFISASYYCADHLEIGLRRYDAFDSYIPPEGEKCESCDRRYLDDENIMSLKRSNLCKLCYNNYKSLEPLLP